MTSAPPAAVTRGFCARTGGGLSPLSTRRLLAQIARERGIDVIRGDARELPMRTGSLDLVTAFDVLEHIEEDYLAAAEITRVLRPGGAALIAVPADMALWSAHDEAVNHVRAVR